MQTIADFPYFEVQFKKDGTINDGSEVTQLLDFLAQNELTDLFVISHGWNNDMAEARELYRNFFAKMRTEIGSGSIPGLGQKKFAVLGILWPSMKFAEKELIAGGAASMDGGPATEEEEIKAWLESLKGRFDAPAADTRLEQAKQLVDAAGNDNDAYVQLVSLIRSLPGRQEVHADDNSDRFFSIPGHELADIMRRPDVAPVAERDAGGAASFDPSVGPVTGEGGAAGFNLFGGIKSAVRKVLNFTTYYQMKERAGIVGRTGAYQVLKQVRDAHPSLKLHLIGHSFGGRLVTALADGPDGGAPVLPDSVTLLQAAFSHNGFAQRFDGDRDGFFRKVISEKKVKGPILISHSIKDTAVGIAYAIASKLSGVDNASFNGPESRFGGIGRNGAQHTPEADDTIPLGPVTGRYLFEAGKLYNLKADDIILGHSDIIKAEIAHAVLSAVVSG